jgi:predicted Zn finger-like uncharacterized protein
MRVFYPTITRSLRLADEWGNQPERTIMATTLVVSCPQCHKQFKVPEEYQGKRIRCKECGTTFAAQAAPAGKRGSPERADQARAPTGPAKASPKRAGQPVRPARTQGTGAAAPPKEEDASKPYDVTGLDMARRCPHCAAEMENDEAIVCLNCGYNTRNREHLATTRTFAPTGLDWFWWLLPGALCVVAVLALIGFEAFIWLGLEKAVASSWMEFFSHFSVKLWSLVLSLFGIWFAGRFAVKRLIFHFRPPEIVKRK